MKRLLLALFLLSTAVQSGIPTDAHLSVVTPISEPGTIGCAAVTDGRPCAELRPPYEIGDWKAVNRASQDGVLYIYPGTYEIDPSDTIYRATWTSHQIIGISDAEGNRPKLINPDLKYSAISSGLNERTVRIENLLIHGNGGGDGIAIGHSRIKTTLFLDRVDLAYWHHGVMGGYEYYGIDERDKHPPLDDEYYITNSSCHHSRTHCLYLDRHRYSEVKDSLFYACGFYCLKNVGLEILVQGNTFFNTALDGGPYPAPYTGQPTINSAGPLNLVACQRGRVLDNTFTIAVPEGGIHTIIRQPRESIQGCDQPWYYSDAFWAAETWSDPQDFTIRFDNNTFNLTNGSDHKPRRAAFLALLDMGTKPQQNESPGSSGRIVWLDTPKGWVERSKTVWGCDNAVTGAMSQDQILGRKWWCCAGPSSDPANAPTTPEPQVEQIMEVCL